MKMAANWILQKWLLVEVREFDWRVSGAIKRVHAR
jgi:hypothetical protein